jgi:hypothetical protein
MGKKMTKKVALKDKDVSSKKSKMVKGGVQAGLLGSPEYFAKGPQNPGPWINPTQATSFTNDYSLQPGINFKKL